MAEMEMMFTFLWIFLIYHHFNGQNKHHKMMHHMLIYKQIVGVLK